MLYIISYLENCNDVKSHYRKHQISGINVISDTYFGINIDPKIYF